MDDIEELLLNWLRKPLMKIFINYILPLSLMLISVLFVAYFFAQVLFLYSPSKCFG